MKQDSSDNNKNTVLDIFDSVGFYAQMLNEEIKKNLNGIDEEKLKRVLEGLNFVTNELPKELNELHNYLVTRGWYSISEIELDKLATLLKKDDEEVEKVISEFVEKNQKVFLDNILMLNPERKLILDCAFDAHIAGNYELSIPIFLIQSDGISISMFGDSLFSKDNKKMKLTKIHDKIVSNYDLAEDGYELSFISPLTHVTSISMNTNEFNKKGLEDPFFSPLNRHAIIHGLNTNYASKSNSLRCILLLEFLYELQSKFFKD